MTEYKRDLAAWADGALCAASTLILHACARRWIDLAHWYHLKPLLDTVELVDSKNSKGGRRGLNVTERANRIAAKLREKVEPISKIVEPKISPKSSMGERAEAVEKAVKVALDSERKSIQSEGNIVLR